jgi:Rieske 2Fe-2S family protein
MGIMPQASIHDMARSRQPGRTLPAAFYTSREVFEADLEVFYRRHWILVGVEGDVPEAGDLFKVDIGNSSIIIARDDDGGLNAFHNVCRHRGARLLDDEKSWVARLVCPYHQWTYELTGELAFAPHMGSDFDKCAHNLKPVHLRSIGGLLFVCLSEQAPEDIAYLDSVVSPRLATYGLQNTKIAAVMELIEEGNWKLSIDNNRECYHCAGSHPELGNSLNPLNIGFDPEEMSEEELAEYAIYEASCEADAQRWESQGFPSHVVEHMSDCATPFRTQRFPIEGAGESQTMTTEVACRRLLGHVPERRFGDLHLWNHNSWSHFFSDHAVISYIVPSAPGQTRLRTIWLVHEDAVEGVDYDVDQLTLVWRATNQQDADLVARAQKGVESVGYAPGPLSRFTERLVEVNLQWYLKRLAASGI